MGNCKTPVCCFGGGLGEPISHAVEAGKLYTLAQASFLTSYRVAGFREFRVAPESLGIRAIGFMEGQLKPIQVNPTSKLW